MTETDGPLTPALIQHCDQCSLHEAKAVLASCCYIAFRDRSVVRGEVDLVNAIADKLGITPAETAKIAGKVRRGKMKLKKPKTDGARTLLFHLALHTALSDQSVDARECEAIDHLATQLKIATDEVERELQTLHIIVSSTSTAGSSRSSLADLSDTLSRRWVAEYLEADLFSNLGDQNASRQGELEYAVNAEGNSELSIELDISISPGETLSVLIAGNQVCDLVVPSGRIDQKITPASQTLLAVQPGDRAEIRHNGKILLAGTFQPD